MSNPACYSLAYDCAETWRRIKRCAHVNVAAPHLGAQSATGTFKDDGCDVMVSFVTFHEVYVLFSLLLGNAFGSEFLRVDSWS